MATRAVYSFSGFLEPSDRHLLLRHDGYPEGAARRFAVTLRLQPHATLFLGAFLRTQRHTEPLANLEHVTDAEYRYRIQLVFLPQPCLLVQCWRRTPDHARWHPRSSRMPMDLFIQRFLHGTSRR